MSVVQLRAGAARFAWADDHERELNLHMRRVINDLTARAS
jgi:hypothetical protein